MVAQQGVSSGLAALLIAAVPLWIVLLRALTGDRPRAGDDRGRGRRRGGLGGAGVRGACLRRGAGHHVVGTLAGAAGQPGVGHRDVRDHPPSGAAQPVRAGRRADADGRGDPPGGGHRAG